MTIKRKVPAASLATYSTEDGYKFSLIHFKSAKSTKVAIYVHGNGSSNALVGVDKLNILASVFAEDGIDFISTNNRGSGYIERHLRQISEVAEKVFTGMAYERIRDAKYDLSGMLEYAIQLGYKEIYFIGVSSGANKIAVYDHYVQNKPTELRGYILVSGGDDVGLRQRLLGQKLQKSLSIVRRYTEEGGANNLVDAAVYPTKHPLSYGSLLELLEDGSDYDVFNFHIAEKDEKAFRFLKDIKLPCFYVYGSEDKATYVDVAAAVKYLEVNLPKQSNYFKIIEGAGHNFRGFELVLAENIRDWIKNRQEA